MLNFGRNVSFEPSKTYVPRTEDEVLAILREHGQRGIRCIGSLHSWSGLVAAADIAVDLRHFDEVQLIGSAAQGRVQVGAGCTIDRLLAELRRRGRTLPTVGAIVKQTIGGATATGTHGSGASSLSHIVDGVRLATYDPDTREARVVTIHDGAELLAARCSLGFMGIVLRVVLRTDVLYNVEECFRKTASRDEVLEAKDAWPLQQFAWIPWSWTYLVWQRRRAQKPSNWLWRHLCRRRVVIFNDWFLHRLLQVLVRTLSTRWLKAFFRRWLPKMANYPHRIDDSQAILTLRHDLVPHVEMELFVPETELYGGMDTMRALVEQADADGAWTHHYPLIFRRIDRDETLISMTSGDATSSRAWYSISVFTYLPVERGFDRFARAVAERMVAQHGARLHWGKYFPLPFAQARGWYPEFDRFEQICCRYDPGRRFGNECFNMPELARGGFGASAAEARSRS